MLKVLLAGAVALPAAAAARVMATGVAFVDVRAGGAEGHRIVLPVPLLLAETALSFVPQPADLARGGELAKYLPAVRGALAALAEGPDAELVRVDEEAEHVVISKVGEAVQVEVHGHGEDVSVSLPLSALRGLLREDGRIDPAGAVRALRQARFRNLVDVRDGHDHVRVAIF